jgi:hypothetical protein
MHSRWTFPSTAVAFGVMSYLSLSVSWCFFLSLPHYLTTSLPHYLSLPLTTSLSPRYLLPPMPRCSLLVAAVALLCVVAVSRAQPFYQHINSTSAFSTSTDGQSNNVMFFDIPGLGFSTNFSITVDTAYSGKSVGQMRFFLRRWAIAGSNYDEATSFVEANAKVNASLNPSPAFYYDVEPNSQAMQLFSDQYPVAGRYFLSVFAPSALEKGKMLSYTVNINIVTCPQGTAGIYCTDGMLLLLVRFGSCCNVLIAAAVVVVVVGDAMRC